MRYAVVTDRWFDPVRGFHDRARGDMVAIRWLDQRGEPVGSKWGHTVRGLASQGWRYASMDYQGMAKARLDAMRDGVVVGIGKARVIRARPKVPGG